MDFIISEYKNALIVLLCASAILVLIALSISEVREIGIRIMAAILYHGGA